MGAVSFVRRLLIWAAYIVDGFLGIAILAVAIWLIRLAFELPATWMPEYYDPRLRFSNTTVREYRQRVWVEMSDEQRAEAREKRVVKIATYVLFIALYIAGAYVVIKYIWPLIVDIAKTI